MVTFYPPEVFFEKTVTIYFYHEEHEGHEDFIKQILLHPLRVLRGYTQVNWDGKK